MLTTPSLRERVVSNVFRQYCIASVQKEKNPENKIKIIKKMENKEVRIIFKPIGVSLPEEKKRMDEMCKILYQLYCQYEKSRTFHVKTNDNLAKEKSA